MKGILLAFLIIINTTFILPQLKNTTSSYFIAVVLLVYVTWEIYDYIIGKDKEMKE